MKKIFFLGLLLLFTLTACKEEVELVEIQFHLDGGTFLNEEDLQKYFTNVEVGSDIPVPSVEKEGYELDGWYIDSEYTTSIDFMSPVMEDLNLYPKWEPVENYIYLIYDEFALDRFLLAYDTVEVLSDISLNGFTFEGWYRDSALTQTITSVVGNTEIQYIYGDFQPEVINLPAQTDIDLTVLGYFSYLDEFNPVVHIKVEGIGTMSLQLFPDVAKNTVDNFIKYIEDGEYNGSRFHRIINDFMIQGGIVENTACSIVGEFSNNGITNDVSHTRGALSMARTSVMDSATSQFFIVHEDSLYLDNQYATFGGLVNGFDVLDYIATLTRTNTDVPLRDVIIESITIDYNGYVASDRTCVITE
jgi:peptidyl-prolyl cis-trans isomerase B (cyclophilin B)